MTPRRIFHRAIVCYLVVAGGLAHAALLVVFLVAPDLLDKARYHLAVSLEGATADPQAMAESGLSLRSEIARTLGPWGPLAASGDIPVGESRIGSRRFKSLKAAARALRDGQTLVIGPGVYNEPLFVRANNVTIRGDGHAVIENAAHAGKAAMVVKGDGVEIVNLECRHITVPDGNGACVRQSGQNLKLSHVYFHGSQQGVLAGSGSGRLMVEDSRFERLGFGGRAHGIYTLGNELGVSNSVFVAIGDGSHAIKSRAAMTVIENSLIASLSAKTGRLLDISNGGELIVTGSVLAQGPATDSSAIIGYGLEKIRHKQNRITLEGNTILLERRRGSRLLRGERGSPEPVLQGNTIITDARLGVDDIGPDNPVFESREAAGLPPYPYLPLPDS